MNLTRRLLMGGLAAAGFAAAWRSTNAEQASSSLPHLSPEQRARYEATRARMMQALSYERVTIAGEHALAEWERLRAAGRGWPVVVGNDEDLERIAEQFSLDDPNIFGVAGPGTSMRSPAQILSAAADIRFPQDLDRWSGAYRPEDLRAPLGEWPAKTDGGGPGLSVASDVVSGKSREKVHILLVPAKHGWEVPAYLRWGGWNACPPPEYHVAALRRWGARFGADLVGLNADTMNLRVRARPASRAQSLPLARDMYRYCPDIVDQGVGSISALAAGLMASHWWYLWWD